MFLQSKNKNVFLEPGGDNSLTGELYQLYALQLIAYLRRHVATIEDAEDLLLEVFLEAFEHENMLTTRDTNGQRAWLWTVARNKGHLRQTYNLLIGSINSFPKTRPNAMGYYIECYHKVG